MTKNEAQIVLRIMIYGRGSEVWAGPNIIAFLNHFPMHKALAKRLWKQRFGEHVTLTSDEMRKYAEPKE